MLAAHLPLRSSEIRGLPGSSEHDSYIATLHALLAALAISNSTLVLQPLTAILCRDSNHIAEAQLSAALAAYVAAASPSVVRDLLQTPLRIFLPNPKAHLPHQLRHNALHKVAMPMLRGMANDRLMHFFLDHINQLMDILSPASTSANDVDDLVTRAGSWDLIHLAYSRLPLDFLKPNLNDHFTLHRTDKTPLIKVLSKLSKETRDENATSCGDEAKDDVRLQLRCAAHNALVAIITKTQTHPAKFYTGAILQNKHWEQIVSTHRPFRLTPASSSSNATLLNLGFRKDPEKTPGFIVSDTLASSSLAPPPSIHNHHDFNSLPSSLADNTAPAQETKHDPNHPKSEDIKSSSSQG